MSTDTIEIWIPLLNEGTPVSRPTRGEIVGRGIYRVLQTEDYDPEDEEWAFPPGTLVRGVVTTLGDGKPHLLAAESIGQPE